MKQDERGDDGITMVELLIYMFVSALFLGLLASLFVTGLQTQQKATDRDSATEQAGIISNSILTSIRNSSAFTIVGANQALIAKVITESGTVECRAWVANADGSLLYAHSPNLISTANTAGWTRLVRVAVAGDGVRGALAARSGSNPDGSPRFTSIDADSDGRTDAFSRVGNTLSFGLTVTRGEAIVPISNGATVQALADGAEGAKSCW